MDSTASRVEKPRIGIFGIGLQAYWEQFASLQERLTGYLHVIEERLGQWGDVVSGGMVDTYETAREAGERLASAQVDVLFVYAATYATSSIVLPVVQAARAPVVLLNLQPIPALDYETMTTEEWLADCSACCVPEIGGALTRAHIPYKVISGALFEDERAWNEIEAWCRAAGAAHAVRHARLGFLGHPYAGMLDMYTDFTAVSGQLGSYIEVLEIDDLVARVRAATEQQTRDKLDEIEPKHYLYEVHPLLFFNFRDELISCNGREEELTELEFRALYLLVKKQDSQRDCGFVSMREFAKVLYPEEDYRVEQDKKRVQQVISKLRNKMKKIHDGEDVIEHSNWGRGYRLTNKCQLTPGAFQQERVGIQSGVEPVGAVKQ